MIEFQHDQHGGWTPNPEGVQFFIDQEPARGSFQDWAPHLVGAGAKQELIALYKAWKDVNNGQYIDYVAQTIGDCTSQGTGHGIDLVEAILIAIGHKKLEFRQICTEALYGAGRATANMLGTRGDGCYGAAMAEAAKTIGVASRQDLGEYDGARARQWGSTGLPADVKSLCSQHRLLNYGKVSTWDEYVDALASLRPVAVCSNQGFTLVRDQDGFCRPKGSWPHCMLHCGARQDKRPGGLIFQSWGPESPTGPLVYDQPPNSFWADRDVVEEMLAAGDSWALDGFGGWAGPGLPDRWSWGGFATPTLAA